MIPWFVSTAHAELPPPLATTPYAPPRAEVRTLSDGVPVYVMPRRPTGTVDVWLVVRVDPSLDPEGMAGLGSAAFTLSLRGAGGIDAATISSRARSVGAQLSTTSAGDWSAITLHGLRDGLAPALDLWAAPITAPAFDPHELEVLRTTLVQKVQLQRLEPAGAADRVQRRAMYGPEGRGRSPTEESLRAIDPDHLRTWWSSVVAPGNVAVVAGGDVTADELVPLLESRLASWTGGQRATLAATPAPLDHETVWVVDVKGAPQSAIRAFEPTRSPDDPERAAFDVAIDALGGGFTSRINRDLREQRGWTYGARCATPSTTGPLFLQCSTLVRADVTGPALAAMRSHLRGVVSDAPLTAEEVEDHGASLVRAFPGAHETVRSWLVEQADSFVRQRSADWASTWLGQLAKLPAGDPERVVKRWLEPDRLGWVVAGDLATIRPQLEALGLPLVVVEP
jgi:predicted Zn-dependent peptidase